MMSQEEFEADSEQTNVQTNVQPQQEFLIEDPYASSPWVEKYRPIRFDEIVLEELNKKY